MFYYSIEEEKLIKSAERHDDLKLFRMDEGIDQVRGKRDDNKTAKGDCEFHGLGSVGRFSCCGLKSLTD